MNLSGRSALVTGASKRIGRAVAHALGSRGARVAIHYGSSADQARATTESFRGEGIEAFAVQADLSRPDEIDRLFEAIASRFAGLDILVNSAASFESVAFDELDADAWDRVLAVNLRAPFLCIQRAARLMRASERPEGAPGAIVNITDLSALGVWRGYAHHSVSKAGLAHLTRVSAWELAPAVRVNAIAPGAILPPPGTSVDSPEWQRRGDDVPTGRVGSPERVAETAVFLCENDFLNGVVVPVDGGEHMTQGGRE